MANSDIIEHSDLGLHFFAKAFVLIFGVTLANTVMRSMGTPPYFFPSLLSEQLL